MEKSKKIVLFDIDHTLFNTRLYSSLCYLEIFKYTTLSNSEEFIKNCDEIYSEQRKTGPFNISQFVDALYKKFSIQTNKDSLEKIFTDRTIIQKALYSDVMATLRDLSLREDLHLGIFSTGPLTLQNAKINSLLTYLYEEHIHINELDKSHDISDIVEKHKNNKLFVVDDLPKILHNFKVKNDKIVTILIERDTSRLIDQVLDFKPDYKVESLDQVITII